MTLQLLAWLFRGNFPSCPRNIVIEQDTSILTIGLIFVFDSWSMTFAETLTSAVGPYSDSLPVPLWH